MGTFLQWLVGLGTDVVQYVMGIAETLFSDMAVLVNEGVTYSVQLVVSLGSLVVQPCISFIDYVFGWLYSVLPTVVQSNLAAFWTSVHSGVLREVFIVLWYLVSFFVPPSLLLACVVGVMFAWLFGVVMHLVMWVVSMVPKEFIGSPS